MKKKIIPFLLVFILPILIVASIIKGYAAYAKPYDVETFLVSFDPNYREGKAKIYDECGDQSEILQQELTAANDSQKSVLIVYGAEWCIWCHVFDKYVKGENTKFILEFEHIDEPFYWFMRETENKNARSEAKALNEYVAANFIITHIENRYVPNGLQVMLDAGPEESELYYLPYIVALNANGKYAGHLPLADSIKGLEVRTDNGEEFRGYNRVILLDKLKELRSKASPQ